MTAAKGAIQHVSDTAFLIAHCRALESARPDGLFRDPLAERLAGERGKAIAEAFPTYRMTSWVVAMRTAIIDDFLQQAVERGVRRIVNLGAGLDTRPYRLQLPPDLEWIEVDFPDVIAFKAQRLQAEPARCELQRVAVDLGDAAARGEFLSSLAARPGRVLVLTEGVVPYLDEEQVAELAEELRAVPTVEGWIVEYMSPASFTYRRKAGLTRHLREAPFRFQPADWYGFFAQHGWQPKTREFLAERARRVRRRAPLPAPVRVMLALLGWLAPREKREGFRKSVAYVWLEPAGRTP